jgi:hypothetical protein
MWKSFEMESSDPVTVSELLSKASSVIVVLIRHYQMDSTALSVEQTEAVRMDSMLEQLVVVIVALILIVVLERDPIVAWVVDDVVDVDVDVVVVVVVVVVASYPIAMLELDPIVSVQVVVVVAASRRQEYHIRRMG